MHAKLKSLTAISAIGILAAGCSMNNKMVIQPDENVVQDWEENVTTESIKAQTSMYHANQSWLESNVTFHDYVQRDMGLNPGEVWYPTYAMADGRVTPDSEPMTCGDYKFDSEGRLTTPYVSKDGIDHDQLSSASKSASGQ
ncbi:MAG: hypothetical protein AAFX93_13715 [Verrucomicrobiota bacterium]